MRDVIRGWCTHCHQEFEHARCPDCARPPGLFALEVSDAPNVYAGRKVYRDLARTSTEAQQAVARIRQDLERGRRPDDARVELRVFCEQLWLPIIEATVDVATVLSYRGELERHVWTRFGGWPLAELSHAPMRRWLQRLLDRGRRDGRGGLAPRTVDYIRRLLHRALDLAVDGGYLADNPCPERTPRPRGGSAPTCGPRVRRPYVWTDRELARFLEETSDERLAVAWRLVADCGLWRGEVLGLRWIDLDLAAPTLTVDQAYVTANGRRHFTAATGNARRTIPLDGDVVAALREQRRRQDAERDAAGSDWVDHGLVVCQPNGRPIDPDNFSKTFTRRVRTAGVPRLRLADLRNLHGVRLLEAGTDPDEVATRLGHASGDYTVRTTFERTSDAHVAGVPVPDPDEDADRDGGRFGWPHRRRR